MMGMKVLQKRRFKDPSKNKFPFCLDPKAQSTVELTVLFIILIGALICIQVYFKRSIQGRWKAAVEEMTDELYDPFLSDSEVTYRTASNSVVEITTFQGAGGFWTIRQDHTNSLDSQSGQKLIGGY